MKLLARILLILFVHQLSVHGEPIYQNINLTAENQTLSNSVGSLPFGGETSVTETLLEFNAQEDEFNRNGNILLTNSSQLGRLPSLPSQNINLTKDDSSRLVLNNKVSLIDKQAAMKDVKDTGDKLEREKSVTVKPFASLEEFSTSHPAQEEYHKYVETPGEEELNISDASKHITAQGKDAIATQNPSSVSDDYFSLSSQSLNLITTQSRDLSRKHEEGAELGDTSAESFVKNATATKHLGSLEPDSDFHLQEHNKMTKAFPQKQTDKMDKYELSASSPNLTNDLLVPKVLINKQKDRTDNLNTFNQSRVENNAKTINEYRIDTKPVDGSGFSQTSNLAESELIEIVLKEATNLNKNPEEDIESHELTSSNTDKTEDALIKGDLNEEVNLATEGNQNNLTLLETSGPINNTELVSIVLKKFDTSHNYKAGVKEAFKTTNNLKERQEENTGNSEEALDVFTGSTLREAYKPSNNFERPQMFSVTKSEQEIGGLEGLRNINKTQEENALRLTKTNSTEAEELILETSNSLKTSQTFIRQDTSALTKSPDFNRTEDKYLSPTFNKVDTSLESFKRHQNYNKTENEEKEKASKEVLSMSKNQEDQFLRSLVSLAKINTTFLTPTTFSPFEEFRNFTEKEDQLKAAVSKEFETDLNSFPFPIEITALTSKSFNDVKGTYDCNMKDGESKQEVLVEEFTSKSLIGNKERLDFNNSNEEMETATSLSDKITDLSSVADVQELTTSTSSNIELTTDAWNTFEETYRVTGGSSAVFENHPFLEHQQYFAESSSVSLEEEEVEEKENEFTSKPIISLEEYAVKQMNFILDHLLLETQKFVAEVLQATINSVFPRDRLKHYAEGVNQVLNPALESDYSDEIVDNTHLKIDSQDEIYEQIVEKFNFLKNKPSKYLQKQIPPEWLNDFLAKRSELAIWLDKAAEQMHKEFTNYITELEDPIKYQYFNETFDDIYRATEIHHKLTFLADLVKIIKNKKQITFMDLYMQT